METNILFQDLLRLENPKSEIFESKKLGLIKLVDDVEFFTADGNKTTVTLKDIYKYRNLDFDLQEYVTIWNDRDGKTTKGTDVMTKSDYVVFFIPEKKEQARFIDIFKINSWKRGNDNTFFDLQKVDGFDNLKERVVVYWKGDISYAQYWFSSNNGKILNEKYVISIDDGLMVNATKFVSYQDVMLSFEQLKEVINQKEWKDKLTAVKGIYCITDKSNGKLYIGSAYGEDGIWGRWNAYVRTGGCGGNNMLEDLVETNGNYARNFQWSILETLPLKMSDDEVIHYENIYKQKLCTRLFGYNQMEGKGKVKKARE